jgi:protocatechuate 3,4-dioxygenase beta subunit
MTRKFDDIEGRRQFLRSASAFALSLPAVPVGVAFQHSLAATFLDKQRPSSVDIVDRAEPGTRILMRGTVFDPGGKPVPNVAIFVYHTDSAGYYSRPVNNPRQARLRGTVWSDAKGQYQFSTIKPAHYAEMDQPPPMHIHVHLHAPGLPNHWVDSYYFDSDPRLRSDEVSRTRSLGQLSSVVLLAAGKSGVFEAVRDFRIDPEVAARNQLANDWNRQ